MKVLICIGSRVTKNSLSSLLVVTVVLQLNLKRSLSCNHWFPASVVSFTASTLNAAKSSCNGVYQLKLVQSVITLTCKFTLEVPTLTSSSFPTKFSSLSKTVDGPHGSRVSKWTLLGSTFSFKPENCIKHLMGV